MRKLTVRGILEFSERIETESFDFYTAAERAIADASLKKLCRDLATQEQDHVNQIRARLDRAKLDRAALEKSMPVDSAVMKRIVATSPITPGATPRAILTIAHQREMNTRQFYSTLLTLTELDRDIVKLFEELMRQEELHAESVKKRLARL